MKVSHDNCNQHMMKFKDLPLGSLFVEKEVPETAAVYLKMESVFVNNCVNVNTGKLGFMVGNADVFVIDAELKWKYQE